MANDPPPRTRKDTLAREVDRLLLQLPGADPTLRGDRPPAAGWSGGKPAGASRSAASDAATPSLLAQRLGVWTRVVLAAGLAVAVTYWPYARACGFPLYAYLAVVGALLIAGAWAASWAWRLRLPGAHVVALGVMFWGVVLSAEQVLPRVGYAAESAAWGCGP